jgi:hypothetical protein
MPATPSTVWMVSALTGPDGVRGELSVENSAVVFRTALHRGETETFRLDQIRRARRVWGSPVLELQLGIPNGLPEVAFYFMKPPSLMAPEGARFATRRGARRKAVAQLYKGNADKRTEIEAVLEEIRQAGQASHP